MFKKNSRVFQIIILSLLLLLLGACTSLRKPAAVKCQEADWYELGRRDGANGEKPKSLEGVKAICADSQQVSLYDLYNNGYFSGLTEFCSLETAFELGRTGQNLAQICPADVQVNFKKRYSQGRQYHRLEVANRNIELRIKSIFEALDKNDVSSPSKSTLKSELLQLKKQLAKNEEVQNELEEKLN